MFKGFIDSFKHACLKEWEAIPLAQKNCSFAKFKNNYESLTLERYSKDDA